MSADDAGEGPMSDAEVGDPKQSPPLEPRWDGPGGGTVGVKEAEWPALQAPRGSLGPGTAESKTAPRPKAWPQQQSIAAGHPLEKPAAVAWSASGRGHWVPKGSADAEAARSAKPAKVGERSSKPFAVFLGVGTTSAAVDEATGSTQPQPREASIDETVEDGAGLRGEAWPTLRKPGGPWGPGAAESRSAAQFTAWPHHPGTAAAGQRPAGGRGLWVPKGAADANAETKTRVFEAAQQALGAAVKKTRESKEKVIDQRFVGLLVGRGGENIARIQAESGAEVWFDQSTNQQGFSTLRFQGSHTSIARAKEMVDGKLTELRRSSSRGHAPERAGKNHENYENAISEELRIDQSVVGCLIGPGGKTLRSMQDDSNTHLLMDQHTRDQGYSTLKITGDKAAIEAAKILVSAKVPPDSMGPNVMTGSGGLESVLKVRQMHVGLIIGKRGETLQQLQEQSGGVIVVDQSTREQGFSIVRIRPGSGAARARELVTAKINDAEALLGSEPVAEELVTIDQRFVGLLIGQGGEHLRQMKENSGAAVWVDQGTSQGGYSTVHIAGSREAVAMARAHVDARLSEAKDPCVEVQSRRITRKPQSDGTAARGSSDCEPGSEPRPLHDAEERRAGASRPVIAEAARPTWEDLADKTDEQQDLKQSDQESDAKTDSQGTPSQCACEQRDGWDSAEPDVRESGDENEGALGTEARLESFNANLTDPLEAKPSDSTASQGATPPLCKLDEWAEALRAVWSTDKPDTVTPGDDLKGWSATKGSGDRSGGESLSATSLPESKGLPLIVGTTRTPDDTACEADEESGLFTPMTKTFKPAEPELTGVVGQKVAHETLAEQGFPDSPANAEADALDSCCAAARDPANVNVRPVVAGSEVVAASNTRGASSVERLAGGGTFTPTAAVFVPATPSSVSLNGEEQETTLHDAFYNFSQGEGVFNGAYMHSGFAHGWQGGAWSPQWFEGANAQGWSRQATTRHWDDQMWNDPWYWQCTPRRNLAGQRITRCRSSEGTNVRWQPVQVHHTAERPPLHRRWSPVNTSTSGARGRSTSPSSFHGEQRLAMHSDKQWPAERRPVRSRDPRGSAQGHMQEGKTNTAAIKVAQRFVGWLIGRGGGAIQQLSEQSGGVVVQVDQMTSELGYSTVHISGPTPSVERARVLVERRLAEVQGMNHNSRSASVARSRSAVARTTPPTGQCLYREEPRGASTQRRGAEDGRGGPGAPSKLLRAALTALLGKWYCHGANGTVTSYEIALGVKPSWFGSTQARCWSRPEDGSMDWQDQPVHFEGRDIFLGERTRLYLDAISDRHVIWADERQLEARQCWSRSWPAGCVGGGPSGPWPPAAGAVGHRQGEAEPRVVGGEDVLELGPAFDLKDDDFPGLPTRLAASDATVRGRSRGPEAAMISAWGTLTCFQ